MTQQKQVLEPALKLLQDYKIVVLGEREFGNVDLAKWLSQKEKVYLSLRLKKNEYVELEEQIWFQLSDLGLAPGMSVDYQGVKVTKTKGFSGLNLAAKWKRNYRTKSSKEPWLILTNLNNLMLLVPLNQKELTEDIVVFLLVCMVKTGLTQVTFSTKLCKN